MNNEQNGLWIHSVIIRKGSHITDDNFSSDTSRDFIKSFFHEHPNIKDYLFQLERGEKEGKLHYQMYIKLHKKQRSITLEKEFRETIPHVGVQKCSTLGRCALKHYCMKKTSRVKGPWGKRPIYFGNDLKVMETPFHWQYDLVDLLDQPPDDRTIIYIWEKTGNVGKSKLVKWMCFNKKATRIPLGTATQLKCSVISEGAHKVYLIDIPRSIGSEERLGDLFSAIEEVKNGHIKTAMYGKPSELFMEPPHVVVFSNYPPSLKLCSVDRWKCYIPFKIGLKHYVPKEPRVNNSE